MDRAASAHLARLAVANSGERVLEIGAGTGALSEALLAAGAQLTAIEFDRGLAQLLRERPELRTADIVEGDALTFDYASYAARGPWSAAGNLPYYITTPLLFALIEARPQPDRIVVMVQSEVADRLVAQPGSAQYGSLSIALQYAMRIERKFRLRPAQFYPRPGVDSRVVLLERHQRPPVESRDAAYMLQVVRAAFAYRRKTLANSLALAMTIPRERVTDALRSIGLDPEIRGEKLTLAQFAALAEQLAG